MYNKFFNQNQRHNKMKYIGMLLIAILFLGCSVLPPLGTPFSAEDPTINGNGDFTEEIMISSTKKRYWMSYKVALEAGGYTVEKVEDKEKFPNFKTIELTTPEANVTANTIFWKEGRIYANSLCTSFFNRLSITHAHRQHAQKQTNIAGGLVSAILGLSGVPSAVVGGAGALFNGAESSFDAYNTSFLATPNVDQMQALVRKTQQKISSDVNESKLEYVSDVLMRLNEYSYPCSFTGMQNLLDSSINEKITNLEK